MYISYIYVYVFCRYIRNRVSVYGTIQRFKSCTILHVCSMFWVRRCSWSLCNCLKMFICIELPDIQRTHILRFQSFVCGRRWSIMVFVVKLLKTIGFKLSFQYMYTVNVVQNGSTRVVVIVVVIVAFYLIIAKKYLKKVLKYWCIL